MFQELQVFLLAMIPIGELRGAIPYGLLVCEMDWLIVFIISVIGNAVPIFFLVLFLKPVSDFLSRRLNFMDRFFNWVFERTRKKHRAIIDKHGWWGIMTFVAIPLPMTGGWTGALLAFLIGMSFKKAFSAVFTGIFIAGIIVTSVVKTGLAINDYFGGKTLAGILILILLLFIAFHIRRKSKIKNQIAE